MVVAGYLTITIHPQGRRSSDLCLTKKGEIDKTLMKLPILKQLGYVSNLLKLTLHTIRQ